MARYFSWQIASTKVGGPGFESWSGHILFFHLVGQQNVFKCLGKQLKLKTIGSVIF